MIVGAVAPATTAVHVVYDQRRHVRRTVTARLVQVRDPRVLAAMGLRQPFAYYVAELTGPEIVQARVVAYDAGGRELGRASVPNRMPVTPGGDFEVPGRGCDPQNLNGLRARYVHTLPPADVRSRLAALRRPQRAGDLPPGQDLRTGLLGVITASIQVDAIRRLGPTADGERLYLIPRTGRPLRMGPAAGCLRTLTPQGRRFEARGQAQARRTMGAYSVSTTIVGPKHGGGSGPSFDLGRWRAGRMTSALVGHEVVGLVPDGVARVELLHGGLRRSAAVRDNTWSVRLSTSGGYPQPAVEIWRDAHGRVLRRLTRQ